MTLKSVSIPKQKRRICQKIYRCSNNIYCIYESFEKKKIIVYMSMSPTLQHSFIIALNLISMCNTQWWGNCLAYQRARQGHSHQVQHCQRLLRGWWGCEMEQAGQLRHLLPLKWPHPFDLLEHSNRVPPAINYSRTSKWVISIIHTREWFYISNPINLPSYTRVFWTLNRDNVEAHLSYIN